MCSSTSPQPTTGRAPASLDALPFDGFTEEERTYQDLRLNEIIAQLWSGADKGNEHSIKEWRDDPGVTYLRRSLFALPRDAAVSAYFGLVRAIVAANSERSIPFVPVDLPAALWPHDTQPVALFDASLTAFHIAGNILRDEAGVFTPGKLRVNKHYTLLIAHMLCWHKEIRDAKQIIRAYPWPFVVRIDEEGTPRVDRQPDIRGDQWDLASRIERTLFDSIQQTGALAYGTHPTTMAKGKERADQRLVAGGVAYRLRQDGVKGNAICKTKTFVDALTMSDGSVIGAPTKASGVWRYIDDYRKANNLPPPKPGEPT